MATTEKMVRQGVGFPDWVIVSGVQRWFDWYDEEVVTELRFDIAGRVCAIAVDDRYRRVIRAEFLDGSRVNLYDVPGLVRMFGGSVVLGHTEWFVARD